VIRFDESKKSDTIIEKIPKCFCVWLLGSNPGSESEAFRAKFSKAGDARNWTFQRQPYELVPQENRHPEKGSDRRLIQGPVVKPKRLPHGEKERFSVKKTLGRLPSEWVHVGR
jgi:hypothetical protein